MGSTLEKPLYIQIVSWIRQEIREGRLSPGDRLPSIRQMTHQWSCTPGTVQKAYAELSRQRLVISRSGQGTHVIKGLENNLDSPLRKATLLHQAEAFFLESIVAGYQVDEVEVAVRMAAERWKVMQIEPEVHESGILRFAGSHDPALTWLAAHFPEIIPRYRLQVGFTGSLGGLIALAEGQADLSGCHLWDQETDTYNIEYVRKLLPGRQVALVTFAHRRMGLILPTNNPNQIEGLKDLERTGVVFVNRQPGSGTRVWLDAHLRELGIATQEILGYQTEKMTHTDVAAAIALGNANVAFGLESAAIAFGLDYHHLVMERYDLVIPLDYFNLDPIQALTSWLTSDEAHREINKFGGYDTAETGKIRWVL